MSNNNTSDNINTLATDDVPVSPKERQIIDALYQSQTQTQTQPQSTIPKFQIPPEPVKENYLANQNQQTGQNAQNAILPPSPQPAEQVNLTKENFEDGKDAAKPRTTNKWVVAAILSALFFTLSLPQVDGMLKVDNVYLKNLVKVGLFFFSVYIILYFL
jgi:hypothetical protein